MATDFTAVDAAEKNFDEKMAAYKEADTALGTAIAARDAAAAALADKEAAVTEAEDAKAEADADAEAALAVYTSELDAVGIAEGSAPVRAKPGPKPGKRGRKPKEA